MHRQRNVTCLFKVMWAYLDVSDIFNLQAEQIINGSPQ